MRYENDFLPPLHQGELRRLGGGKTSRVPKKLLLTAAALSGAMSSGDVRLPLAEMAHERLEAQLELALDSRDQYS